MQTEYDEIFVQELKHNTAKIHEYRQTRYLAYRARSDQSGPGENGTAVVLTEQDEQLAKETVKDGSINVVASEKIALDRSIPDLRIEQ